ncbi:hypothetical protein Ancab_027611 [Ancistrocladus abbreviatus]
MIWTANELICFFWAITVMAAGNATAAKRRSHGVQQIAEYGKYWWMESKLELLQANKCHTKAELQTKVSHPGELAEVLGYNAVANGHGFTLLMEILSIQKQGSI